MKPKDFGKKLTLNKRTISHLNDKEMKKINGGWRPTDPTTGHWPCCIIA